MKSLKYPTLVNRYRNKISILRIGVDCSKILAVERSSHLSLRDDLQIDKSNINIGFLGTVAPYKGIRYLLKAFGQVRSVFPNTRLYIVGNYCIEEFEQYKTILDRTIEEEKIGDYVSFTGWRSDALEILALMDIYVLPSLSEGVPRSIVEAMMLGKPVVATRVGGIMELVRHEKTGFVIEPMDSDEMAKSIIALAKDEGLRRKFGAKARSIALKQYSIKDNIDGLEKTYVELVGKAPWRRRRSRTTDKSIKISRG